MATPTPGTVNVSANAASIHGGRLAPVVPAVDGFATVTMTGTDVYAPNVTANQAMILDLHASSGAQTQYGSKWIANLTGPLASPASTTFRWNLLQVNEGIRVQPVDRHAGAGPNGTWTLEGFWLGWVDDPAPRKLYLYMERRLDRLMTWVDANLPQLSATKRSAYGMSMGAWGVMTYAARRPNKFAAVFSSRPRLRFSNTGRIDLPLWPIGYSGSYLVANAPMLSDADGGGSAATHLDLIAHASNPANELPWLGWCMGRNDGFAPFQDTVDMVAAMRATGRGFAVAWNNGDHSGGEILNQITNSYSYSQFELGKGYPVFSESSRDADPAVDLTGGINLGFKFRNLVESSGNWSCEVTNILGPTTVKVKPKSPVFLEAVTAQDVSIPAANTWVAVSFSV